MPNVSNFGAQTDNAVVQGTVTDRAMVIPDIPPQGLMSVGPRVTPHFVKPSLWSALTTYHFFDAVHDAAGASYVAIKPEVPAGTELTDEEYWFLWADPNSQFADLSEIVKTYNGRITKNTNDIATNKALTDAEITELSQTTDAKFTELTATVNKNKILPTFNSKNIMFVTDSWGVNGAAGSNVTKSYPRIVCEALHANLIDSMVSATGFINNTGGSTYLQRLTAYQDKENVSTIVLQCSINDTMVANIDNIIKAFTTCVKYCKENYTNADVYVIPIIHSQTPNVFSSAISNPNMNPWYTMDKFFKYQACALGCKYLANVEYCLEMSNGPLMHTDSLHPNQAGSNVIANAVVSAMLGNFYIACDKSQTFTLVSGSESRKIANVSACRYDNSTVINFFIEATSIPVTTKFSIAFDNPFTYNNESVNTTEQYRLLNGLLYITTNKKLIAVTVFLNLKIGEFGFDVFTDETSLPAGQYILTIN